MEVGGLVDVWSVCQPRYSVTSLSFREEGNFVTSSPRPSDFYYPLLIAGNDSPFFVSLLDLPCAVRGQRVSPLAMMTAAFLFSPSPCSVVWAVGLWVEMARAELVKDVVFQALLKQLQESLVRDQLEDDLRVMNIQIMNSMRQAPAVGGVDASKPVSSLSISVSVCSSTPVLCTLCCRGHLLFLHFSFTMCMCVRCMCLMQ